MFEATESILESSKPWFNELLNNNNLEFVQLIFIIVTGLWIAKGTWSSFRKLTGELEDRGVFIGQRRKLGEKKIEAEIRKKDFETGTLLLELKLMFYSTLLANQIAILVSHLESGNAADVLNTWLRFFILSWAAILAPILLSHAPENKLHRNVRKILSILLFLIIFVVGFLEELSLLF
jgi:hypothetical protein